MDHFVKSIQSCKSVSCFSSRERWWGNAETTHYVYLFAMGPGFEVHWMEDWKTAVHYKFTTLYHELTGLP